MKDQLNAAMTSEMDDNPFSALGMAMAGRMVEGMVDSYITPAGITRIRSGARPGPGDGSEGGTVYGGPLEGATMGYSSLSKFTIEVDSDSGDTMTMIMSRRRLGWMVTEVIIPLDV